MYNVNNHITRPNEMDFHVLSVQRNGSDSVYDTLNMLKTIQTNILYMCSFSMRISQESVQMHD